MQKCVKSIDAGDADVGLLGELDRRTQKSLNLKGATSGVILVHECGRIGDERHGSDSFLGEVGGKHAALSCSEREKFFNDTRYECMDA